MIEQFSEMSKRTDLIPNISLCQSYRMHLGTFTEVCVKRFFFFTFLIKYFSFIR